MHACDFYQTEDGEAQLSEPRPRVETLQLASVFVSHFIDKDRSRSSQGKNLHPPRAGNPSGLCFLFNVLLHGKYSTPS